MFSKGTVYKGVGGCRDVQLICRSTGLVAGSYEPRPEGLKGQAGGSYRDLEVARAACKSYDL